MVKKGGGFFEEHIEKIILGVVGLVCLWLFTTRVLISPNYVRYDGRKFTSGQIDRYIRSQAERLEKQLSRPPEPPEQYPAKVNDFIARMDSAARGIDCGLYPPVPAFSLGGIIDDRKYSLPQIGSVEDVEVGHIRAVAYMPVEDVYEQKTYANVQNEPNDIDFVTVSAGFNVARLYEDFYESFAGSSVEQSWRDPCLAQPVFAAVELDRQQQLAGGGWSDWQVVPRTRIDHRRDMFRIVGDLAELPAGGMKVRMLQFDNAQVRADLLQPVAYKIASAEEQWFPPLLHKKYLQRKREIKARQRRQARQVEKQEREREIEQARTDRIAKRAAQKAAVSDSSTGISDEGKSSSTVKQRQREREPVRPEKSTEAAKALSTADIYEQFSNILITDQTDFARLSNPVTFWAYDDTVEPGKRYRYRVRLGVFNPIAGTEQFAEGYEKFRSQVILWSSFSDVTEVVEVPRVLYFFPWKVQEAIKRVEVIVCRYVLGYWYMKPFVVSPGEVIGKVARYEPAEAQAGVAVPERIDYSTGAVLMDTVAVNDWLQARGLQPRRYVDMLYSFDGSDVEHVPIGMRFWADDVRFEFNQIKRLANEEKKPLRGRDSRPGEIERSEVGIEGGEPGGYEPGY